MSVWHACFMLVVAMATRISEEHGSGEQPRTPCQELAREKAFASPWLRAKEVQLNGLIYDVGFDKVLGAACEGATGIPSVLSFTAKKNATRSEGPAGFKAVLKVDTEGTGERANMLYSPEVELTYLASQTNGLCAGVVQGAHVTPDRMYLLTEYFEDGTDMRFKMQLDAKKDDQLANYVVAQLIYILKQLEEQRIIHRDIKAANLMLVPRKCSGVLALGTGKAKTWVDEKCKIVLIDYGLACTSSEEVVRKFGRNLACQDQLVGSPNEVAPEVLHSDGWPTTTTDVFSMGVTIFFMLTGGSFPQDAFLPSMKGLSAKDKIMEILNVTASNDLSEQVDRFDKFFPDSLKGMVKSMLQSKPGQRPTASALWTMLKDEFRNHAITRADEALETRKGEPHFQLPLASLYFPTGDSAEDQPVAGNGQQPTLKQLKEAQKRDQPVAGNGQQPTLKQLKEAQKRERFVEAVRVFKQMNEQLLHPPVDCVPSDEDLHKDHSEEDGGPQPTLGEVMGQQTAAQRNGAAQGCLQQLINHAKRKLSSTAK